MNNGTIIKATDSIIKLNGVFCLLNEGLVGPVLQYENTRSILA
jgi:hypothetical protein